MCTTVLIPCNRDHANDGAFMFAGAVALATTARLTWWTLRAAWWALEHLVAALIIAAVWTAPRTYRLVRRGSAAAWRWYALRPVVLDKRAPVAAITDTTTALTLADLRIKEPANS